MREGHIYCVNHPEDHMVRNEGFNALTTVKRENGNVRFESSTGVPTVVFYCNTCGYIEVYAAQKTPYWERAVLDEMKTHAGEDL